MTVVKNPETKVRGPRWLSAIIVCASAVGLAALLGAAMTPPVTPAAATAGAVLQPTEQENYVARRVSDIIAREHREGGHVCPGAPRTGFGLADETTGARRGQ